MPKVKASDLFLISDVDVRRGGTEEKPKFERVKGNRFVSETDLTAKEIESIKPFGVMRVGTMAEMETAENREENESAADAAKSAEEDRVRLMQEQKLEADQAAEREKAAKAAAGSGGKKK